MQRSDRELEHPAVTRALRYGVLPARDPLCPVCARAAETFYFSREGECLGCCECVRSVPYDEMEDIDD